MSHPQNKERMGKLVKPESSESSSVSSSYEKRQLLYEKLRQRALASAERKRHNSHEYERNHDKEQVLLGYRENLGDLKGLKRDK